MIKTAKLNDLKYICFDEKETLFKTKNEDLTLLFSSDTYDLKNAIVHLKNGKLLECYTLKQSAFTIKNDSDLLQVGRLDILIDLPELCKTWVLDGIKIRETDNSDLLSISSYREEVETKLADFDERLKVLEADKVPFNL